MARMPLPPFLFIKIFKMNNRSKYKRSIARLPQVKRFMNQVVEAMGYNVSMFNTKEGKYFASLQAFELDVLDKSGFNEAEKKRMLNNGKIDTITLKKLDNFLKQKGIEIPSVMSEYGQISADIANEGAKEYAKLDRARGYAGKSPLITVVARVKGTSEGLVNELMERRNYILSYEDDQQNFMGRKARDRRRQRKDERQERKIERRQQKADNRLTRLETRQTAKTDRIGITQAEKTDRAGLTGVTEKSAGADIASGIGSAVSGVLGGSLGSIFSGGGAIPDQTDETRFINEDTRTQASLFGSEGGSTSGLFKNGIGTKELVAIAGLSAVAYALFKIATAK